ncbi:MAG: ABC transporter permease subunit [Candidatus Latescibacterota bacterium]
MSARARVLDRLGGHLITVGGIGVIAAVLGILVFVLVEAYPLFRGVRVEPVASLQAGHPGPWLEAGVDPYRLAAFVVGEDGVRFLRLADGAPLEAEPPVETPPARVASAHVASGGVLLALGLEDGRVQLLRLSLAAERGAGGERGVRPAAILVETLPLDPAGEPIVQVRCADDDQLRSAVAGITASGRVLAVVRQRQRGLLGPGTLEQQRHDLTAGIDGRPTALLLDSRALRLLVGTNRGTVLEWGLAGPSAPPEGRAGFVASSAGSAVTALGFVLGEVSVVVGDAAGGVGTWVRVPSAAGTPYRRIHVLDPHSAPVTCIAPSQRDKQFLTGDAAGGVALHHMTAERTYLRRTLAAGAVAGLAFAPKADGFLVLGQGGGLGHFALDNPHPDVTLGVLFAKVWYEGHPGPAYVWQSTGGSDEFEPKLSLVPLIFGTAKGTLYAMLLALPLAVLAALYTAEFAAPRVRALVKPTVEVMASLPSVVLGFLAGLWLAPAVEGAVVGTLLLFPVVPSVTLAAAWAWHQLPEPIVLRMARRWELLIVVVVSLLGVWAAYALGPHVEATAFGGDFVAWLTQTTGARYDQRNCLVVGFAMGFAVIPLVFTICEDALSSVPPVLRAGSLALGATRWQTATRVALPMALPGVFSAAMIGFGRAIGETMIVLMATGNTPVLDWSPFNGMRTVSANIAVELPEAPYQGSLYRVLFLSGLLLFAVTFCVNTVAELVRQRLRERYSHL